MLLFTFDLFWVYNVGDDDDDDDDVLSSYDLGSPATNLRRSTSRS